jgi:hypothetical protein
VSIFTWKEGFLVSESDETILKTLAPENLTLVTYDLSTIPTLLATLFVNRMVLPEWYSLMTARSHKGGLASY